MVAESKGTDKVAKALKGPGQHACEVINNDSVLFLEPGSKIVVQIHPGGRYEVKNIEECTCEVVHGLQELKDLLL